MSAERSVVRTFRIEVKTPKGWEVHPGGTEPLSEFDAYKRASELGLDYWAHFMGGEEKVRIVPVEKPNA